MNTCVKCHEPAPEGHELCWFCEHTTKLHKIEPIHECSGDSCEIGINSREEKKKK